MQNWKLIASHLAVAVVTLVAGLFLLPLPKSNSTLEFSRVTPSTTDLSEKPPLNHRPLVTLQTE